MTNTVCRPIRRLTRQGGETAAERTGEERRGRSRGTLSLIGTDGVRAAQDECALNGLGSQRLLVYVAHLAPTDESGEGFHIVHEANERWVVRGRSEVLRERTPAGTRRWGMAHRREPSPER